MGIGSCPPPGKSETTNKREPQVSGSPVPPQKTRVFFSDPK